MTKNTAPTADRAATTYVSVGDTLQRIERPLPRRLLGIWAHPDDEAYLSAGLMARVVEAGGSVTVVTATRGEKGTSDPATFDSDEFGRHRELELRDSLLELGVHDVRFLDLRDGECDLADNEHVIDEICQTIEDVLPDAIVTFGPDGMTNHADHRAVSRWTTEAWRRAGHGELLYAAVTHLFLAEHHEMHHALGVYADFEAGRPPSIGRDRVALECALTGPELDLKRRALAAHASQTTALASAMGEQKYRTWFRDERFRAPTSAELGRSELPVWMLTRAPITSNLVGAAS